MSEKTFTMLCIDAAGASDLPQDLRHLIFALAYLANSRTGKGLSGQETIGRFMGISAREVRRKLDRLEALASPVRVSRRYRSAADGRGRTSDEYQLELTNRTPTSAETERPTGRPRPGEGTISTDDQPDVKHRPTGRETSDQPDAGVQGSSEGSSERILGASLPRTKRGSSKPKTPRTKKPKPERTPEQKQAFQALTAHYYAEFERLRSSKPIGFGAKEGKAVWDLLDKCQGDAAQACLLITNGLAGWAKATIMVIAANPSACVASGVGASTRPFGGVRAADLQAGQRARAERLAAEEEANARKALSQ